MVQNLRVEVLQEIFLASDVGAKITLVENVEDILYSVTLYAGIAIFGITLNFATEGQEIDITALEERKKVKNRETLTRITKVDLGGKIQ